MSQTLLVVIISIVAVGIFVLGMSLTLIFKGRNIDSEIATNKHMQQRGIKCAAHEGAKESSGCDDSPELCSHGNCATCTDNSHQQ